MGESINTMRIPKINTARYPKLYKKLRKTKNKYQIKQIKRKNEVWHYGKRS